MGHKWFVETVKGLRRKLPDLCAIQSSFDVNSTFDCRNLRNYKDSGVKPLRKTRNLGVHWNWCDKSAYFKPTRKLACRRPEQKRNLSWNRPTTYRVCHIHWKNAVPWKWIKPEVLKFEIARINIRKVHQVPNPMAERKQTESISKIETEVEDLWWLNLRIEMNLMLQGSRTEKPRSRKQVKPERKDGRRQKLRSLVPQKRLKFTGGREKTSQGKTKPGAKSEHWMDSQLQNEKYANLKLHTCNRWWEKSH